jgi:hypothetical protein
MSLSCFALLPADVLREIINKCHTIRAEEEIDNSTVPVIFFTLQFVSKQFHQLLRADRSISKAVLVNFRNLMPFSKYVISMRICFTSTDVDLMLDILL